LSQRVIVRPVISTISFGSTSYVGKWVMTV
jgi:hypothetical protein